MSKPIFIVRLPNLTNPQEADALRYNLSKKMDDYHVIVICFEVNKIIFECYNTTDLDTKSFEELKELVKTYKTE